MSITKNIAIIQTLDSFAFNKDGSMDAWFSLQSNNTILPGFVVHIPAQVTSTILEVEVPTGTTIKQALTSSLYNYLESLGTIFG